jgi:hypothetical protein
MLLLLDVDQYFVYINQNHLILYDHLQKQEHFLV